MIKGQFAKNLHRAVSEKGIRQVELSKALNVPPTTVSGWFRGAHYPDLDKLMELCDYLNMPVGELVGDKHHITLYSMDAYFEKLAKVSLLQKDYIEMLERELSECDTAIDLYAYVMALKKAGAKSVTIGL